MAHQKSEFHENPLLNWSNEKSPEEIEPPSRGKRELSDANQDARALMNFSDEPQVKPNHQPLSHSEITNKRIKTEETRSISSWEAEKKNRRSGVVFLSSPLFAQYNNSLDLNDPFISTPIPLPTIFPVQATLAESGEIHYTSILLRLFKSTEEPVKFECNLLIKKSIDQFNSNIVRLSTMQELVVFSSIPDNEVFLHIVKNFQKAIETQINTSMLLHGIAVVLNRYPEKIDLHNITPILTSILGEVYRQITSYNAKDQMLLSLLQSLSVLLDVMVSRQVIVSDTEGVYVDLEKLLQMLKQNESSTISFVSRYMQHALRRIKDSQSMKTSQILRSFLENSGDITNNDGRKQTENSNEKQSELVTLDYFDSDLYDGITNLDKLIEKQNWKEFEESIQNWLKKISSNSDDLYLGGACLRLEQLAATQSNEISEMTLKMLIAIKKYGNQATKNIADETLARLKMAIEPQNRTSSSPDRYLPPFWDSYWKSHPGNTLLMKAIENRTQLIQDLYDKSKQFLFNQQIRGNIALITDKEYVNFTSFTKLYITNMYRQLDIPTLSNMDKLRREIRDYYAPYLKISGISEGSYSSFDHNFNLESCMIDATIGEDWVVVGNYEHECHKQDLRLNCNDEKKPLILLEQLFNVRNIHPDGKERGPKRILIQGRAGIGKSTLCKKMVHLHQKKGMWENEFEVLLWIPLRQLKLFKARNLRDLLIEKFFPNHIEKYTLAQNFLNLIEYDKVLFILDGLDEIAEIAIGTELDTLLQCLLGQNSVIITTRSHDTGKMIKEIDLEMELLGFSNETVYKYIKIAFSQEESVAQEIQNFIKNTDFTRSLVKIPAQLELVCYSWSTISKEDHQITMTELYRAMVYKVWRVAAYQLNKKAGNRPLGRTQIQRLQPYQLDRLMESENDYLSYLSFNGIKDGYVNIYFDETKLKQTREKVDELRQKAGKESHMEDIIDQLKLTLILHPADSRQFSSQGDKSNNVKDSWYFLHLAFQEYFAASWIARHLVQEPDTRRMRSLNTDDTLSDVENFIKGHLFDKKFRNVWCMVAGLLEEVNLERFFDKLENHKGNENSRKEILKACLKEVLHKLDGGRIQEIKTDYDLEGI